MDLKSHDKSKRELDGKLKKLEEDATATQQDATERALRDRPYEFRRKGHEEQFSFNVEVGDRIDVAAIRLSKLTPSSDKDKATLKQASVRAKGRHGYYCQEAKAYSHRRSV